MAFIDEAQIDVQAGKGGNGIVAFRREKFIEFGGPDGGDGGNGGSVFAVIDENMSTLMDFKYKRRIKAGNGQDGKGDNRTGAAGADFIIRVPPGTEILCDDEVIFDMDCAGPSKALIAQGGRGGLGNTRFKTSVNRAPRKAIDGEPGEAKTITLRLKLLSNVGIVGLPNAGKSTFLASCTAAKPKVASYPFSTLQPNLGVAIVDEESIVLADIPGLIEGASDGHGLGIQFLQHIERCQVILHLIDVNQDDCLGVYHGIRYELSQYSAKLSDKVEIVALNKCDSISGDEAESKRLLLSREIKKEVFLCSGVSGVGVENILRRVRVVMDKSIG